MQEDSQILPPAPAVKENAPPQSYYSSLLKSSIFTGGAQVVMMLAGLVRAKLAAVFIGPLGIGMLGLYVQSTALLAAIASLGLGHSAIREIAAAHGTGNPQKISRVILSLRILVWLTGILATLACFFLAPLLSEWTFGNREQTNAFRLLSIGMFFGQLSMGQIALLRGLRKIRELALQNIIVALLTTLAAAVFYWRFGIQGIVPTLLSFTILGLLGSWCYARKVKLEKVRLSFTDLHQETRGMIGMGLAFVWNMALTTIVGYLIAIMIRKQLGVDANGLYQAAWAISIAIVAFVITAMTQDFYPRLTGLIRDKSAACKLLNEQTEIAIFLALAGLIAVSSMSRWIIPLLYTNEFLAAAPSISCFVFACFIRVVAWPLGMVLIAKGTPFWFAATELLFAVLNITLSLIGLSFWGLPGVALGFALMYLINLAVMHTLARRMLGFHYTKSTLALISAGTLCLLIAPFIGPWLGLLMTALCGLASLRLLSNRLGRENRLIKILLKIKGMPWLLGYNTPHNN